ncbi:DNA-binding MarR family transcriptional regulator [Azospirillum fermentarium]|uniref:MarR family winged helix-turn-helix transcriptional regulator n=1 Tax=Azospirillum fermentarium TaxID=1233114 RepID=UPI002225E380|nr:MarR family transcriptional regulator [Azospirillum fermentarium]MCW2244909.1 DNA-binding MarR family transcriptional regulator [Azospirillum fermentarium]
MMDDGNGEPNGDGAMLRLDSQLCFAVYSAAHAFTRLYKTLLDALGLTYPQYLVMLILWEGDNLAVKELGGKLQLDSGTLTPLLKRLEAAGLIHRTRDPHDERLVRISLTEAGVDLRAKASAVPPAVLAASGCSLDELTGLKKALLDLRDHLNAASGFHP